jgi:hypothetical protein
MAMNKMNKANAKGVAGMAKKPSTVNGTAPSQGTPTMPLTPLTHKAESAAAKGTAKRGFAKGGMVKSTGKLNTGIKSC